MFKKFLILFYELSLRFISMGLYYKIPSQARTPAIQIGGNTYYLFGNIGRVGYYSDVPIIKDKKANLNLVSWEKVDLEDSDFIIQYPSGKEEKWDIILKPIEHDLQKYKIHGIYQVSPYTFKEEGLVKILISKNRKRVTVFRVKVRKD